MADILVIASMLLQYSNALCISLAKATRYGLQHVASAVTLMKGLHVAPFAELNEVLLMLPVDLAFCQIVDNYLMSF